MDMNHRASK